MHKLQCLMSRLSRAAAFSLALCLSSLCFGAGPVLDRVPEPAGRGEREDGDHVLHPRSS